MVISPQYEIIFLVSEMISHKTEKDRCRMLAEAIAVARAGQIHLGEKVFRSIHLLCRCRNVCVSVPRNANRGWQHGTW